MRLELSDTWLYFDKRNIRKNHTVIFIHLKFKDVFSNLVYFVYCKHDISCLNGLMSMKLAGNMFICTSRNQT